MAEAVFRYCDVALPVPIERLFTYELPVSLRNRVRPGCRVWAPFGSRKLTDVVLSTHDEPPTQNARDILRLLDEEPVLDADLLRLAQALQVPLQWFLTGSGKPGRELPDLALELFNLGVLDLWVGDATVPGAFRPPEQLVALAVSGSRPEARTRASTRRFPRIATALTIEMVKPTSAAAWRSLTTASRPF